MKSLTNQQGFTLTELITIILIVGIISVVALPRFTGNDVFQQRGAADQVRSALRFAQKVAIAKHTPVSVTIAQGATNCELVATLAFNCTVAVLDAGAATYTFSSLGQLTAPVAPAVLTIGATSITIQAETGYVQ